MTQRRRFNRSEKNALYLASGGVCSNCGEPLQVGWHGDHVQAYSKGGQTDLLNGQALCPKCNQTKGSKDLATRQEIITFRPFQTRFIDAAIRKAKDATPGKTPVLVADVHPGSGKTISVLCAADRLMAARFIEQVVIFVPRLNLAHQFEQDWFDARQRLPWTPIMGKVHYRPNELPLLFDGAHGYISTYGSLCANPLMHIRQIASKRTLVIFDEAQQLGVDGDENGTQSATYAAQAGDKAAMVIVMSGTPTRADGSRLLFAEYDSKPNKDGMYPLQADVSSTYRDGVRDGYLRRFEAALHDGGIQWQDLMEGEREIILSEMDGSIRKAIQHEGYWKPLVDRFVEKLTEIKGSVDSRMCGMIAADDQAHARRIVDYLKKHHRSMRVVIAVSNDGEEAHKNLKDFRTVGKHDILVTVQMAYVGYDHKPIMAMCVLTSFRTDAYLRQLLARGLRVWNEVDPMNQALYAFVPDDPEMRKFVERLREESQWGYKDRIEREEQAKEPSSGKQQQEGLGYVLDAWLSRVRAMGIDPTGDLTPAELEVANQLRIRMGIVYPVTDMMAFHRGMTGIQTPAPKSNQPYITEQERLDKAKRALKDEARKCDYKLRQDFGTTYKQLYGKYGSTELASSVKEIEDRMKTVARWKEQGYYD